MVGTGAAIAWASAAGLLVGSIPKALSDTRAWLSRLRRRPPEERPPPIGAGDVALSWLLVPVSVVLFVAATVLVPLILLCAVFAAVALARERSRALEMRRRAGRAADSGAVFVSYRTAEHGPHARAIFDALAEDGHDVWLDADRGTLPTYLLFVDRVLEEAIRNARALVVLQPGGGEEEAFTESFPDRLDQWLATGFRSLIWFPAAFAIVVLAPLLLMFSPLVLRGLANLRESAQTPWRTASRAVPPDVRRSWYRRLGVADVARRPGERWQAWEERVGSLYGVPRVTVAVVDDVRRAPPGVDVVLGASTIAEDVRARLVAALRAADPDPTAPLAAAQAQMRAALRTAGAHPLRTLVRGLPKGTADESQLAALVRSLAAEDAPDDRRIERVRE